jgi:hypothetical protein
MMVARRVGGGAGAGAASGVGDCAAAGTVRSTVSVEIRTECVMFMAVN